MFSSTELNSLLNKPRDWRQDIELIGKIGESKINTEFIASTPDELFAMGVALNCSNRAVEFFKTAHAHGHVGATNELGLFKQAQGEYELAAKFYEEAHYAGYIPATNNLGYLYGNYLDKKDDAFKLFQIAHAAGYLIATYNLADCYVVGIGCIANPEKAAELHTFCLATGDSQAEVGLLSNYRKNHIPFSWVQTLEVMPIQRDYHECLDSIRAGITPRSVIKYIPPDVVFDYFQGIVKKLTSIKSLGIDNSITSAILEYAF